MISHCQTFLIERLLASSEINLDTESKFFKRIMSNKNHYNFNANSIMKTESISVHNNFYKFSFPFAVPKKVMLQSYKSLNIWQTNCKMAQNYLAQVEQPFNQPKQRYTSALNVEYRETDKNVSILPYMIWLHPKISVTFYKMQVTSYLLHWTMI